MRKIYIVIIFFLLGYELIAQSCPTGISPAQNATNVSVKPTFTWTSTGSSSYAVVIINSTTNQEIYSYLIGSNVTSYNFEFNAFTFSPNTTYDWYIKPWNIITGYTTGCEVNKKRFTTGTLTCVANIFPANGAISQNVKPSLTWQQTTGANLYDVYLGTSAFNTTLHTTTSSTSYTITTANTLATNTIFYWYVVPKNSVTGAAVGCDVNITSFTTGDFSCTSNLLPANNATNQSPTPTLTWNSNAVASSYDIYFGTDALPTTLLANVTQSTYSLPVALSLLNNTTYYWYVVPKNGTTPATGCETSITSFTTASLNCVTGITPTNGQTTLDQSINLTWATTGATSYDVYLGTSNPPTTLVGNTAATNYGFTNYLPNTTYYWYIVPKNGNNAATGCTSNTKTFNTGNCAQNSIPPNNSLRISSSPVLSWLPFAGATLYDLYLGFSGQPVLYTANIPTNTITLSIGEGKSVNWYVIPKNASGSVIGCPSNTFNFVTRASVSETYACPYNYLPLNGAVNVSQTTTLSWDQPFGTNMTGLFNVYLGTSPTSIPLIASNTSNSYTINTLLPNTKYYWYASSITTSGSAPCANIASFTTTNVIPSVCIPAYSIGCDDGISSFSINGESSLLFSGYYSCGGNPTYNNFYNTINTDLVAGKGYMGTLNLNSNSYVSLWIDFNNDGLFNLNENILSNLSFLLLQQGSNLNKFSIYVPLNAPVGEHRLRLRLVKGTLTGPMDPCATYASGRTYDYKVNIMPASAAPQYSISNANTSFCGTLAYTSITGTSNNNEPVPIFDKDGGIVALINANGNNLGMLESSSYKNVGALRKTSPNGSYYVDRNITITPTSQPSNGNVSVRLYYTAAELAAFQTLVPTATTSTLNITKTGNNCSQTYAGPGTFLQQTGNGAYGTDYFVDISTPSFSSFFIKNSLGTLPLSVAYFKGSKQLAANILDWKLNCDAGTHINVTLEHSVDGIKFNNLQTQNISDIMCQNPFSYKDYKAVSGSNYYRLKITSANGEIKYSQVIKLLNKAKGFELINMVPNPVKNNGTIVITSAKAETINIAVSDAMGKVVLNKTVLLIAGSNNIDLRLDNIAGGIYFIKAINDDGELKTLKFVKY